MAYFLAFNMPKLKVKECFLKTIEGIIDKAIYIQSGSLFKI